MNRTTYFKTKLSLTPSQINSTVKQLELEQQLVEQLIKQRVGGRVGRELWSVARGCEAARLAAQVRGVHDDRRPYTEPVARGTPAPQPPCSHAPHTLPQVCM